MKELNALRNRNKEEEIIQTQTAMSIKSGIRMEEIVERQAEQLADIRR